MSECKYCLQCKPESLGSVNIFLEKYPKTGTLDTPQVEKLMDVAGMDDWVLEKRSFANMRHRLIPVNDDSLVLLTVNDKGQITCLRNSDDETTFLKS
jgi:hypothetical protein